MSKYSMVMSWSEEDQAYIVSVPELPGCMADGKTPEEAVKNTEIIIQEWLETALEDGEEIPEPHLFSMPVQIGAVKIFSSVIRKILEDCEDEGKKGTQVEFTKVLGISKQGFTNIMARDGFLQIML